MWSTNGIIDIILSSFFVSCLTEHKRASGEPCLGEANNLAHAQVQIEWVSFLLEELHVSIYHIDWFTNHHYYY